LAALVELSALGFRLLPGHHPVGIDLFDRAHPDVSLRGFAIKNITGKPYPSPPFRTYSIMKHS
jgi:hypothetical protein